MYLRIGATLFVVATATGVSALICAVRPLPLGLDFEGGEEWLYVLGDRSAAERDQLARTARERFEREGIADVTVMETSSGLSIAMPDHRLDAARVIAATFREAPTLTFAPVADVPYEVFARAALPSDVRLQMERAGNTGTTSGYLLADEPGADEKLARAALAVPELATYELRLGDDPQGFREPSASHVRRTYFTERAPTMDTTHLAGADATLDPMTRTGVVSMKLDDFGAGEFEGLTEHTIGRRLAICRGAEVLSAPVVQSRIAGGSLQITMGGGAAPAQQERDARALADALNRGGMGLPAPTVAATPRNLSASWLVATGSVLALLALGIAVLVVLRHGAKHVVLAIVPWLMLVWGGATAAIVGTTLNAPVVCGALAAVAESVFITLVLLESMRRQRAHLVAVVVAIAVPLMFAGIATLVTLLAHGPLRGAAIGVLATMPAALLAAILTSVQTWPAEHGARRSAPSTS